MVQKMAEQLLRDMNAEADTEKGVTNGGTKR